MRRRSRAGGKPVKTRRRKALAPKRSNEPKTTRRHEPATTGKVTEVARLRRERDDALEQQTATADILKVISRSTFDLQVVLDTLTELAARLCHAERSAMRLLKDGLYHHVASYGHLPEYKQRVEREPLKPGRAFIASRVALEGKSVHVIDALLDPSPEVVDRARTGNVRTALGVPLLRQGTPIGVLLLQRRIVQPFTDKEIALAETFADQAVIAIENVRLFEAEQQRTRELSESLEQQTATSEVLRVISSSPGDLEPVFASMLENAVRICDATFGNIYRTDGDGLRIVATHNTPSAFADSRRSSPYLNPGPKNPVRLAMTTKAVTHTRDVAALEAYAESEPVVVAAVELGGMRTLLTVPMLKDNELVGVFILARQEVRPFSDKQIALVTSFANQAVIAIENARLLNELRQSLEQQTATSEVLQVISSSPGDLEPVFTTMLESAVRICDATFGNIYRWDGDALHIVAAHNTPPAFAEVRRRSPNRPSPKAPVGRMVATKTVIHVTDLAADQGYIEQADPASAAGVELGGTRTALYVPMLKDNALIGAFTLARQEVRPFTDKQIALVTSFASQAVIAIENARLLNELRQSLEQQTATSEILASISGSVAETKPVFDAIVRNLLRLFGTRFAVVQLVEDGMIHMRAIGGEYGFERLAARYPLPCDDTTVSGRAMRLRQVIQYAPVIDNPAAPHASVQFAREFNYNSMIAAPMIRGGRVVGVVVTARREPQPFDEKQIALIKAFADQAVIAVENTRLFEELRERTDEVVKLNQHLEQRVADQVGEIERMGRLRRFLPPQVADLIVASGTEKQLESHRREISALFCDLRGFTGFSESSDPEDVMALLRDYHAAIGEIIIKYSGTLERYAGDGVMVVFNDPVPVDNPALQAVLMALEMRDAIGALTDKWGRLGHDIGFGIGIAHGYATLGTIGFEGRFDYAAIGTVSNVASRLCDEAKPGQILISPRVLMAVEDAVTVEPVGEFALKGIRRPLAAHNVVAAKAAN